MSITESIMNDEVSGDNVSTCDPTGTSLSVYPHTDCPSLGRGFII